MGLTSLLNRTADRLDRFVEEGEAVRARPERARPARRLPDAYHRRDARPLEDKDVDSFLLASGEYYREQRELQAKPPTSTPRERDDFIAWLGKRHPIRTRRLGHDFDWLRSQAKKYGINPEEVRWLL